MLPAQFLASELVLALFYLPPLLLTALGFSGLLGQGWFLGLEPPEIQIDLSLSPVQGGRARKNSAQLCNPLDLSLSANVGTSWSENDFNSRRFTKHKCRQAPSDNW